jgi:hypothetical protein
MSSLKLLLDKKFFQNSEHFVLIRCSDHETAGSEAGPEQLIVEIDEHSFYVCQLLNSFTSVYEILIESIRTRFENGQVYCVRFGSKLDQIDGLICFHDIPKQMPIEGNCHPIGPIHFSVSLFDPNVFNICFGTPYETTTQNFGIGFLKVKKIIEMFIKKYESEYNIQKLWFIFVIFLRQIGYFDIFDYNNFRVFSFILFTNFVPLGHQVHKNIRRKLLYSFIECLLMNNCQFLIHGQSFRPVRGKISQSLIKLFSGRNPPIVNFFDRTRNCVGLTILNNPRDIPMCVLVSLSTTEVCPVGSIYGLYEMINISQRYDMITALKQLLPRISSYDDIDDINGSIVLKRSPAGGPNTSFVENGRFVLHGRTFLIFKSNISRRNVIQCFIECIDGTFESIPSYFLTLLFAFAPDNRFFQLDDHFDGSIDELVNSLIRYGFEKIFNGTASPDELRYFIIESHFGILLQILIREYEAYNCVICDAIQETTHFKNFKSVLQIIIRLYRKRKNSELSLEIHDLLQFLDLLI